MKNVKKQIAKQMILDGYKIAEISKILHISRQTVYNYKKEIGHFAKGKNFVKKIFGK